jgi:hypothetical protein
MTDNITEIIREAYNSVSSIKELTDVCNVIKEINQKQIEQSWIEMMKKSM